MRCGEGSRISHWVPILQFVKQKCIICKDFCRKLHENESNWTEKGHGCQDVCPDMITLIILVSPPPYTTILLHPLRTASTVYCIHCIHLFDLFAPKTMSPPPHTTIPLCPLHTVSTAYCVHCILCPLHTVSTGLTFLYQRQCSHHHIPLFQCVHCILCPLHTASTPSSHLCVILTQPDIYILAVKKILGALEDGLSKVLGNAQFKAFVQVTSF